MAVIVKRVAEVSQHPNADTLSFVKLADGTECVSNYENGVPRYAVGDLVAHVGEGSILPEWFMRYMEVWDEEKGKGYLAGGQGNRMKASKVRGVLSAGMLCPVRKEGQGDTTIYWLDLDAKTNLGHMAVGVTEGQNVSEVLGVTEYVA